MVRAGNSPDPRTPVRRLNKDGIYRISRNPIYVGMICSQLAVGVARRSIATILLTPIAVAILRSKVIAVEESYLESVFGDEYREYCARVPRWLGSGKA
jgi:protein-S-isoprenylcysteine O-methyltransferase Ste14